GTGPGIDLPPPGPQRVRRLSNHELGNTLEALAGVRPESLGQLPPDQRTFVFDRVAAAQTIGPVHLDAFMAVADEVHGTLLRDQRLDDLAPACKDALLPPSTPSAHTRVAGVALIGEPDWAICPPSCSV